MLENQTSGHNTPQEKTPKTEAAKKLQAAEAQVAIYNEDDLSHLLFTGSSFETTTSHSHHHHQQERKREKESRALNLAQQDEDRQAHRHLTAKIP